jgi:ProP effector
MSNSPQSRDSVLALLIATYPVFRNSQSLAIGIHKAISVAHPEIDKGVLRQVLMRHTASTKYLKTVASGGARYGLDGQPNGDVTPEQRTLAKQALIDRFRKQAEQRQEAILAQERQAKLHQLVEKFNQR